MRVAGMQVGPTAESEGGGGEPLPYIRSRRQIVRLSTDVMSGGGGEPDAAPVDLRRRSPAEQSDLLTPPEAASWLRISLKTLANWRSAGTGPAWVKLGSRVAYRRAAVVDYVAERPGLGQQGKPRVTLKTRPYYKDPTRQQVDVMIEHPATQQTIRRRLLAPVGFDAAAAATWGESQTKNLLRDLFLARDDAPKPVETRKPTIEARKPKDETPRAQLTANATPVPTFGQLWERYEADMPTTKESQRRTKQRHWKAIQALVENIPCDAWTKTDAKKVADRFRGLSSGYHNMCFSLLRILLGLAVEDGILETVPRFPRRKLQGRLPEIAHGNDEIAALLVVARERGAAVGENLELLLLLGVDAGLRPAEVAGLRWRDVDWRAGQLIIQNQRPLAGRSDCAVKTDEAGRVTLTKRLRAALEAQRASGPRSPYVITSRKVEPLYTSLVSDRVQKLHELAGLDAHTGHFLRHCAASRIFSAPGSSLAAAQAHLRHKRASTTEVYLHAVRGAEAGREAAAILDALEPGN